MKPVFSPLLYFKKCQKTVCSRFNTTSCFWPGGIWDVLLFRTVHLRSASKHVQIDLSLAKVCEKQPPEPKCFHLVRYNDKPVFETFPSANIYWLFQQKTEIKSCNLLPVSRCRLIEKFNRWPDWGCRQQQGSWWVLPLVFVAPSLIPSPEFDWVGRLHNGTLDGSHQTGL